MTQMYPHIHPCVNLFVIFYDLCIERENQASQRRQSTQSRNTLDEEQGETTHTSTFLPAHCHFGLKERFQILSPT